MQIVSVKENDMRWVKLALVVIFGTLFSLAAGIDCYQDFYFAAAIWAIVGCALCWGSYKALLPYGFH